MHPLLLTLIIIISAFLIITIVSLILCSVLFKKVFRREDWPMESPFLSYDELPDKISRKEYYFYSGKKRIQAYLYGESNTKGFLVYAHGLVPGHEAYISDIYSLVKRGYEVFTYDFSGTGKSEGKYVNSVNGQQFDLSVCLDFLKTKEEFKDKEILLYGHSMGAYGVAMNINKDPNIKAVVSIAGFEKPIKEMQFFITQGKNKFLDLLVYYPLWIYTLFLQGKHHNDSSIKEISKSNIPIMIVHGVNDETVGYKEASILIKKDKINNPNAVFIEMTDPNHDKHNTVIASTECVKYQKMIFDEWKNLKKIMKKEDADKIMYGKIDKVKMNQANEDLMDAIDKFYQNNLSKLVC